MKVDVLVRHDEGRPNTASQAVRSVVAVLYERGLRHIDGLVA